MIIRTGECCFLYIHIRLNTEIICICKNTLVFQWKRTDVAQEFSIFHHPLYVQLRLTWSILADITVAGGLHLHRPFIAHGNVVQFL